MVVVAELPHAAWGHVEFGRNKHREDAPLFIPSIRSTNSQTFWIILGTPL